MTHAKTSHPKRNVAAANRSKTMSVQSEPSTKAEFQAIIKQLNDNILEHIGVDSQPTPMNAVQINIVLLIDGDRALASGSLDGCLFMSDNAVNAADEPSDGRGTARLSTNCNQGMVINWVVYSLGASTVPQIANIGFPERQVMEKLQIYGAPFIPLSPNYIPGVTPWYSYWAGIVLPDIAAGVYNYRLDIVIGGRCFSIDTPSLNVAEIGVENISAEIRQVRAHLPHSGE